MVIEQKYDSIKKLNNGFSLLTVCMNREENLLASLKSWIQIPELNEIVIVNWSSDENYYEKINEFKKYKTIKNGIRINSPEKKDNNKSVIDDKCKINFVYSR